jgi:hypothetical protein
MRNQSLENAVVLNEELLPRYTGGATPADSGQDNEDLRQGHVIVSYGVNARGRVAGLQIVEAMPPEFNGMTRVVQREVRTRIFRPRYEDGEPVETPDRVLTHIFFYLQEELDRMRDEELQGDDS